MSVYTDQGYESRRDYLEQLADEWGVPRQVVFDMASIYGSGEDFDGLVTAVEDYAEGEELKAMRGEEPRSCG